MHAIEPGSCNDKRVLIKCALLIKFEWDRTAPLGNPVVPEVNIIIRGESELNPSSRGSSVEASDASKSLIRNHFPLSLDTSPSKRTASVSCVFEKFLLVKI